jgi:phage shock protein A
VRSGRDRLLAQLREAEQRHGEERAALQHQCAVLQQRIEHLEMQRTMLEESISALRYEMQLLQTRMKAMEASRFWKMRNQWFRVKRLLRLTSEA